MASRLCSLNQRRAQNLWSVTVQHGSAASGAFTFCSFCSVFCCYWAAGWPKPGFSPQWQGASGPAVKLTLACRLGAATSPTWFRFSTTLVVTSDGFWTSCFERRAASLNVGCLHTCLILAACVWCIKIHERCWSGCQGLWQRSSSAQVLRGECWGRLQRDGRGRYGMRGGWAHERWLRIGEGGERRDEWKGGSLNYSALGFYAKVPCSICARLKPKSFMHECFRCRDQNQAWNPTMQKAVGISSRDISSKGKYWLR